MIKRRYYVIVDLEMCVVTGNARKKMRGNRSEIIQIGAVMVDGENRIVDEFSSYGSRNMAVLIALFKI